MRQDATTLETTLEGHAVCLLGHAGGARDHASDWELDTVWAATALLSAYDHELFARWVPGQESAWKGTLDALQAARARVVAGVIPLRLRSYRERLGLGKQS